MSVQEVTGGDWQSSLFNCSPCGSCVLGTFAPCIRKSVHVTFFTLSCYVYELTIYCAILVVGRTSSRLQDPTSRSPEAFNGDCAIHGFLTLIGSGWIYSMIKRTEIRERFGIPGSGFGDCCAAFWCQCCQVIQADNEVNKRLISGPINEGYQPQTEGMKVRPY